MTKFFLKQWNLEVKYYHLSITPYVKMSLMPRAKKSSFWLVFVFKHLNLLLLLFFPSWPSTINLLTMREVLSKLGIPLKFFLHIRTLTWSYFLLRQIHLKSCISQNLIIKWIMKTFLDGQCYYFSRINSNMELIHGIDQCFPSV